MVLMGTAAATACHFGVPDLGKQLPEVALIQIENQSRFLILNGL
jgi:hypothetical protein